MTRLPTILILSFLAIVSISAYPQEGDTIVYLKPLGDTALLRDSSNFDVTAKFVIESTGRIRTIEILKNNCRNCSDKEKKEINDEVINIIRKNPKQPMKDKDGKPRTTIYIQAIIFEVEEK